MNKWFLALGILTYLSGCSIAQKGAMIGAYNAIEENNCMLAYKKLRSAENHSDTTPELRAEITYLRAICLEKEQRYQEALGQHLYLIKAYPESEYSYRSKSKILILNKKKKPVTKKQEQVTLI
ncbi:hypothetical protein [Catenovulum adriaticum]|uniref:Tetratricopeptide repeat protein n=1 Tax=Catenovulum adriaticum TaxID=2984846 RepID=A0ABY7ARS2_9ALTE|nr:hypothetical protein [Catenovulum sp. TS8]WAJ72232.1 hypothetical protein OLW01_18325 [Catenovulum sp. TS8]